jgi:hypothetical protein
MTLLCAAEPWGFGPASKLFAILRKLSPRPRIVLAGAGTCATFGELNDDLVDELVALETPYDLLDLDLEADAVLTVMDPWAALVGARAGVPTYYVDSLFWFWNWDTVDFDDVATEAERWRKAPIDDLRRLTSGPVNWHVVVPMAYHWSTKTFVQRTPSSEARVALYPPGLVEVVGAIVDVPDAAPRRDGPPLVNASGAVSHVTPLEVARRYAVLVRRVLEGVDALGHALITGNRDVLDVFVAGGWKTAPLSPRSMHRAMLEAPFVATPAGLTTALEAAALGVPLIFLPEQHGGHGPNVDLLRRNDPGAYDDILLRRWFDVDRTDPAEAVATLDACYRSLIKGDGSSPATLRRELVHAVERLSDPAERAARIDRQRSCVRAVVGDFDGAATVARQLGALIGSVRGG